MEELDISIINASHFTSKKDNKVYNTINFFLVNEDSLVNTDNFKGYSVATAFVDKNELKNLPILKPCVGIFSTRTKGLKSSLKLESIKYDGKVINLV